ncbi:MAG: hypothetical protein GY696_14325, partial [Gammaproteobacteria bacterium]|nr:hypothetical protein [Gammaproteobacteria bacterium]
MTNQLPNDNSEDDVKIADGKETQIDTDGDEYGESPNGAPDVVDARTVPPRHIRVKLSVGEWTRMRPTKSIPNKKGYIPMSQEWPNVMRDIIMRTNKGCSLTSRGMFIQKPGPMHPKPYAVQAEHSKYPGPYASGRLHCKKCPVQYTLLIEKQPMENVRLSRLFLGPQL